MRMGVGDFKCMLRVVHDHIGGILDALRQTSYYISNLDSTIEDIESNMHD